MKFARDFFLNLVSLVFTLGVTLLINLLVARALGPEGKGLFSLAVTTIGMILLLANLGLGFSAVYYIGQKRYSPHAVTNNLLTVALLWGGLITLLLLPAARLYGTFSSPRLSMLAFLAVVLLTPVSLAALYIKQLFAANHDFAWYNLITIIELGLRAVLLALVFIFHFGTTWAIFSLALSTLLATLVSCRRLLKKMGPFRLQLQLPLLRVFLAYGVRSYAARLVMFLNLRLDQFLILALLHSPADVGLYSVAVALAELATKLGSGANSVLFSRVATLPAEAASRLTGTVLRFTTLFSLGAATVLLLFGSVLIRLLFGEAFVHATPALYLLLPGVVMFNAAQVLQGDLWGRGKPEAALYANSFAIVWMLLGNMLLIPRWGINGAAFTSTLTYAVIALALLLAYLQVAQESWRCLLLPCRHDLLLIESGTRRLFTYLLSQRVWRSPT